MARAEIVLASGAKVMIEGSAEEIDKLLALYSDGGKGLGAVTETPMQQRPRKPAARDRKISSGPAALIRDLKHAGFFDNKQQSGAVVNKLAEGGHFYSQAVVAKALLRLARAKELGRLKEQGVWVYVRR